MCGIRRAEQDEFAVRSQNLAEQAIKNGFYSREITPVELLDGITVDCDDGPRPGVTLDAVGASSPCSAQTGRFRYPAAHCSCSWSGAPLPVTGASVSSTP